MGIKKLTGCVFMLLIATLTFAQSEFADLPPSDRQRDLYQNSIGIRIGYPVVALTFKHFFKERKAIEIIAAPLFGGGEITLLAEKHAPARRPIVYWYYGGGVNAGVYKSHQYDIHSNNNYNSKQITSIGLNIILGIEMNIRQSPFSISFDILPRLAIYNHGGSNVEGAAALKYAIN